jgi:predicted helicase
MPRTLTHDFGTAIKWTRAVKADLNKGLRYTFDDTATIEACYRPFVKRRLYFHPKLNEMQYQLPSIFGRGEVRNPSIVISDGPQDHQASHLSLLLRCAARPGLPREIRAEPET